jgi:hypothetical protein
MVRYRWVFVRGHRRRWTWKRRGGPVRSHWRQIKDTRHRANADPGLTDKLDMLLSLLTDPRVLSDPLAWMELLGTYSPWGRRALLLCVLAGGGSLSVGATLLVQTIREAI